MTGYVADRIKQVERSATVALLDQVNQLKAAGASIVNLSGGEPDFTTPSHIVEAAEAALRSGATHYTPSRGMATLRQAISTKLCDSNGVLADPERGIIVTPSAKHALFITLATVLGPGGEVLVPTPSWVSYAPMVQLLGAQAVSVPLDAEDGFTLTSDRLVAKITGRTRAIVINTPNNPTGRVLTLAEAEAVAQVAVEHDLVLITDEIYEDIRYVDRPHLSLASLPHCRERTVTINGFSKGYAMTGWRLGYAAGPAAIMDEMIKVQEHTVACAASFTQLAGVAALTGPQDCVQHMVAAYDRRRSALLDAVRRLPGVTCADPEGAFYLFPNIAGSDHPTSEKYAGWLLEAAGVMVTPGNAFGPGGEGHVRLSFAASDEVITETLTRLEGL